MAKTIYWYEHWSIKKVKNDFVKYFLKLNVVIGKSMENVRKNRDRELVTAERRRNYLVSEPNFHTTKFFTEKLLEVIKRRYFWINLYI